MKRNIMTSSCVLYYDGSPAYRPFMKVEIGNLVLTGGDCYGGGKVYEPTRGEICFQSYKNLDLDKQKCILPTHEEAKYFSKKAIELEYSFVENYDK